MDLRTALPHLVPKAIAWAESEAARGAETGREPTDQERDLARAVGVLHPERIRVIDVDVFPMPSDPQLRAAAEQTGLLGPGMAGLTLGYSVFVRRGHGTTRLLSHEFRHVHQYERAGSIESFLPEYLLQVVEHGYAASAYEVDARAHEHAGSLPEKGTSQ